MTNQNGSSPGCRVCGCEEVSAWLYPQEMMFGKRELFTYFKCAACDCLQLEKPQANIEEHYPTDYYSFEPLHESSLSWKGSIKRRFISPMMIKHQLGWGDARGKIFCKFIGMPRVPDWMHFLSDPIPFDGRVLDVGCGSGANLLTLYACGFSKLYGLDPYIKESISYKCGVEIKKCELSEAEGKFSLIMFHHVFEHLENPLETLKLARNLLADGGQIMIRIPLSDSYAANKYGEKWVQLDAPRHVTLQTRNSMNLLAMSAGLKISKVRYDSSGFQFWGSEQYLCDIPLFDPRSYVQEKKQSIFSSEEMDAFTEKSNYLNTQEQGDQAAFILKAVSTE